jgi:hypothetical protein
MSKIHLPPTIDAELLVVPVCVSSKGGDKLEIDVDDAGYFVHTPDGYFQPPDLPTGYLTPQTLILFPAVSSGTAYLAYFDSKTNKLYLVVITIQEEKCPKGSEGS